ncbi:CRAL-TRIO domain-containing protein [Nemania sp. NC0429]|nr:CRAL-TRIO domain-containing protein [Nemania sp. NC0429]
MSEGPSSPGTLGSLTPQEDRKLQEAWIYLLHLCGVEALDENANPSKLNPDYTIKLRQDVGERSPESFRQGLWSFISPEHPDALVLRFLRARKWDVEKGVAMLVSAIIWRLERNIADAIIYAGEGVGLKKDLSADDEGFIAQYRSGKSYVHALDRENRLVYIIRARLHDPKLQSTEAMKTYILHNIESLRILIKPPTDKCCLVFDMTGFGLNNMDYDVIQFLVSVFEARYPETLGVVIIHNAPWVFWGP